MARHSTAKAAITAPPPSTSTLRERVRREMAAGMLAAAEEVFAHAGLTHAHVEDIAKRAGVAVGTLYNYYEDRDGLLAAVLKTRHDELMHELRQALERTEGQSARAVLRELTRTHLRFVVQHATFTRILAEGELSQLTEAYPTSAAMPCRAWQSIRNVFSAVIEAAVAERVVAARDDDLDHWLFMGLVRGVVFRYLRFGGACNDAVADHLVDVFFDGAHP